MMMMIMAMMMVCVLIMIIRVRHNNGPRISAYVSLRQSVRPLSVRCDRYTCRILLRHCSRTISGRQVHISIANRPPCNPDAPFINTHVQFANCYRNCNLRTRITSTPFKLYPFHVPLGDVDINKRPKQTNTSKLGQAEVGTCSAHISYSFCPSAFAREAFHSSSAWPHPHYAPDNRPKNNNNSNITHAEIVYSLALQRLQRLQRRLHVFMANGDYAEGARPCKTS